MACHKMLIVVALVSVCHGGFRASALDIPDECNGDMLCDVKPSFYDGLQHELNKKFQPIKEVLNLETENEQLDDPVRYSDDGLNCRSESKVMKPYTVRENGTTMVVVQTDFYQQTFRTTKCLPSDGETLSEDTECFTELTTTSKGRCKTKQSTVILYVYNNKTKNIERAPVLIDVCCVCSIN